MSIYKTEGWAYRIPMKTPLLLSSVYTHLLHGFLTCSTAQQPQIYEDGLSLLLLSFFTFYIIHPLIFSHLSSIYVVFACLFVLERQYRLITVNRPSIRPQYQSFEKVWDLHHNDITDYKDYSLFPVFYLWAKAAHTYWWFRFDSANFGPSINFSRC